MMKKIAMYLIIIALISGGTSQAAVTIYATRTDFDLDYPGLPIEDFEAAAEELAGITEPYVHEYMMAEEEVIDQFTDNDVFHPDDILPGIQITCKWSRKLVVLGGSADHFGLEISSVIISNSSDELSLNILFPEGVNAAAFDIFKGNQSPRHPGSPASST